MGSNDWLINEPTGWEPIIGLVLIAVTIFVVVRILTWGLTGVRVRPVGYDELPVIEPHSPAPYWPAERPKPVLVGVPFAPPAIEVNRGIARALSVALMDAPTQAITITETSEVVEEAVVTNLPAMIEDELGLWDPDAVDWLAPALYVETLDATIRRNPNVLSQAHKAALSASVRMQALSMADAVMTQEPS